MSITISHFVPPAVGLEFLEPNDTFYNDKQDLCILLGDTGNSYDCDTNEIAIYNLTGAELDKVDRDLLVVPVRCHIKVHPK